MTAGKIKENAETHASLYFNNRGDVRQQVVDAYIAGAHSRDEEIKELKAKYIQGAKDEIKMHCEEVKRLSSVISKLKSENNKLLNPWISVEDRLPEKTKGIFSCQVRGLEEDKIVYYKDTRGYIHTGYLNARNHWRDLDRDNAAIYPVTHWMPISELKKGE